MPPFGTIITIVVAYVAIVVLLLSLNIFSRWRWWVKAGAMILCGVFFVVSYVWISSLLGWPTRAQLPDRFSLVASRIVEPNRLLVDQGAIYLWLETLDENNIPSGQPLSYQLPYTSNLASEINKAQDLLDGGEAVVGSILAAEDENEQARDDDLSATAQESIRTGGATGHERETVNLVFSDMPSVSLPGKGDL